jgi:hypothetical protein
MRKLILTYGFRGQLAPVAAQYVMAECGAEVIHLLMAVGNREGGRKGER